MPHQVFSTEWQVNNISNINLYYSHTDWQLSSLEDGKDRQESKGDDWCIVSRQGQDIHFQYNTGARTVYRQCFWMKARSRNSAFTWTLA